MSRHLVTYGTSLTAERSGRPWRKSGGAWVTALRGEPALRVTNRARWGSDSRWGLRNLEGLVLCLEPDAVLVEFGINDADRRRGIGLDEFRKNLDTIVATIASRLRRATILVLAMHPPLGRHHAVRPDVRRYYGVCREIAKTRNLACVDPWRDWDGIPLATRLRYLPDGIHPGADAAREVILPAVREALGLPTP